MQYSARATAQTTGKEKITADNSGLTVDIRDGKAPRARLTVNDNGRGQVFYTCHEWAWGKWIQRMEFVTLYDTPKKKAN